MDRKYISSVFNPSMPESMDDFTNFYIENIPTMNCLKSSFDEKLEAECILRARSIFDEYVCPRTGTVLVCTFRDLLNGILRFWALSQEFKSYLPEIHEWIINLPLINISVLLRIMELEYTHEDHEKTAMDPQIGETLLRLFYDFQRKFVHFRKVKSQEIIFNTNIFYVRYFLGILAVDRKIQRIKWNELRVQKIKIFAPLRKYDFKVILEALRHFRDKILPNFSKRKVSYKFIIENRIPELMEPTLEIQILISDFFFQISFIALIVSLFLFLFVQLLEISYDN